jgi:hypothetical protein
LLDELFALEATCSSFNLSLQLGSLVFKSTLLLVAWGWRSFSA